MEATNAAHGKEMETLQRLANEHEQRMDGISDRVDTLEAEGKGVHEMMNVLLAVTHLLPAQNVSCDESNIAIHKRPFSFLIANLNDSQFA